MDSYAESVAGMDIQPVEPGDEGEILTLQRAAYVSEAQLYDDPRLPALVQTLEQLSAELVGSVALKATVGQRIVGAGRARQRDDVLHIARLTVAPDVQGRGLGTALLRALERLAGDEVDRLTLFTGHLSVANIRLYQRLGYREARREQLTPAVVLIHFDKPAGRDPAPESSRS